MALSNESIASIAGIIIGVILLIIGVVLYEMNNRNKKPQQWYVWALIIGGLIVAVIAGLALALTLRK